MKKQTLISNPNAIV